MDRNITIKVCGMLHKDNIMEVAALEPHYMGFIFYPQSKRFAGDLDPAVLKLLSTSIKKVGVFVDSSEAEIVEMIERYGLDMVQLHGAESPELCSNLRSVPVKVIKAFGIDKEFNFNTLISYIEVVDYFLFDTKSPQHGGTGSSFDWALLNNYRLDIPYFLSGGLSSDNLDKLLNFKDDLLWAVDLNSRFEIEPGLKDVQKLKTFFIKIKNSAEAASK